MNPIPLIEALRRFKIAKCSDGLAAKTIQDYAYYVRIFIKSVPDERAYVGQVTGSDLDSFMAAERKRLAEERKAKALKRGEPLTKQNSDANARTMRARHRALDIFFNWLEDNDDLGNPVSPFRNNRGKKRKPPKLPKHEPRRAQLEDVLKILRSIPQATWLDQRDRAIVQLMLDTGLRAGEVCGLLVADVDMVRSELLVRSGKGDKDRRVPFTEKTKREVTMYLMRRPPCPMQWAAYLFLAAKNAWGVKTRGPLKPGGLTQLWKTLSLHAAVPVINPHSVRHLFGFKLLNDGVRLETVSKLMGHADPGFTLKIYAPLLSETARREYAEHWK